MHFGYHSTSGDAAAALRVAVVVAGPLLALLLQEGACAPAPPSSAAVGPPASRPVWKAPCGEKSPPAPGSQLVPGEPVRHAPTKAMRRVRDQLRVALQHINVSQPTVKKLYGNISATFGESKFNYDWLPRKQLQWFKRNKQCSHDKGADVLTVFHKSLQNFSVTFDAMKRYGESQIEDKAELYALRDSLLTNITVWHKMLHCETETAIHNMRLPVPEWASRAILTQGQWPDSPDLTQTLIRDWGVISRYETFLKEWWKVMRLLIKKFHPACAKPAGSRVGGNPKKNKQQRKRQQGPS